MEEENIIETEINESEVKEDEMNDTEIHQNNRKENEKTVKETKNHRFGWIVLCAIVGLVSGLAGSGMMLAMTGNTHHSSDVIYQSVVQTNSKGNSVTSLSTQDIVKNVKESVVEITTSVTKTNIFMEQFVSSGAGSGVILSKDGLIVTNHHVIANAEKITVRTADGNEYDAELIASDEPTDLAVLRIKADNLQPAVVGDSDSLLVGDSVLAIGNPLGSLGGTVTEGILSALDRDITIEGQSMTLLQTSAAINPGNSGGGLFNDKGELIGIVNAKSTGSNIEGLGFAIPVNIMKTVVKDLVEKGKVSGRLTLGIKYYEISSIQQALQHGQNTLGLLVNEVVPSSNAANAGIQKDDVIVEVDGKQVTTSDDLKNALNSHKVGDTMTLTVVRNKEYVELSCTLK